MITGYPEGSDITLLDTIYTKPKKDPITGKWDKGYITIIYRDNKTGLKHNEVIENPDYEFYFAKEDTVIKNPELFIDKNLLDKYAVPYVDLEYKIAELTGNKEFYFDNIRNGNRMANRELHNDPRVFNSDMHIEDHYRYRFSKLYINDSYPLSKSYLDIEVDGINQKGDFPELGECPINAVTIINEFENRTYTFLLRNPENPLIQEFEDSITEDTFKELKEFIRERVHGWKNEIRFGLDKMEYEFLFYDDEINLLIELFRLINVRKPDFLLAWNMQFDIPYIIERIKALGYNPADIMCHPDFNIRECKYYIDERNKDKDTEKGDDYKISSYTVYLDQLIQYASRRKGRNKADNNKLDTIGELITGVRKLDYSHITTKIAELPYKDYKTFVFYNIMDTIVQKCIESKINDIEYIFSKCLINNTRYPKGHRQTVYIINRANSEWNKDNFIIGNNHNKRNPKEDFGGGFVASATKINDKPKRKINGKPVEIYDNCDDFDYKALYPSEIRENNMAPNTQIGKIIIDNQIYADEDVFDSDTFDRGGKFIEDLQSGVYLEFGRRWLGLPTYAELYKDIQLFYTTKMNSVCPLFTFNRDGLVIPIHRILNNKSKPIYRYDDTFKPIQRYYKRPDCTNIKNIKVEEFVDGTKD